MRIQLQPQASTDLSQRGRTIVYLSGASELLFEAFGGNGQPVGRFQIPAGGQVTLSETFDTLKIQNMGGVYTDSEFLLIEGEYQRLSDVSFVQVQGITNTIKSQVVNQLTAEIVNEVNIRQITETLTAEIANTVDIRQITETLTAEISNTVDIRQITETLKNRPESGALFSATEMTISAGLSVSINQQPLRKEISIIAGDSNTSEININGLGVEAGDSFTLECFSGGLTISGAEGDSFKVCEVFYAP